MRPELFTIPGTSITVPSFGAMVMIGFLGALWWMTRRAVKAKQDPDIVLNIGFISLVFMAVGARAFYVIHYWETQFKHAPGQIISLRSGGFEFYGGLVGAFVPSLLYTLYKRLSVRLWTDMVAPSLLFGMGVGRIGCFLAGCCYGSACPASLPWAVHFPYGSEPFQTQWDHRTLPLPASMMVVTSEGAVTLVSTHTSQELNSISAKLKQAMEQPKTKADPVKMRQIEYALARLQSYDTHLADYGLDQAKLASLAKDPRLITEPLHPAQLYSAVGPLLIAWLTNAYFYRRKRHGTVFVLALTLYAVERFIEESVRTDNPIDTMGLTVSQAISVGILVVMAIWYGVLRMLPLRSPRAVAFVPADQKAEASVPAPA